MRIHYRTDVEYRRFAHPDLRISHIPHADPAHRRDFTKSRIVGNRRISAVSDTPAMAALITDRAVLRVVRGISSTFAQDVRRQRLDAGLSVRELARAAGIDPSCLARIELEQARPSLETMSRIALALGSDLAARMYPNTGPLVRDRHQAPIAESLLTILHPSWARYPEVTVRRPARGSIDWAFHHPEQMVLVATEIESGLGRIEQLLRWAEDKAASLPSSDVWARIATAPATSRLLVVRATRTTRAVAAEYRRTFRAAYPADPEDAIESLRDAAPWPGAALVWAVRKAGSPIYEIAPRA